MLNTLEESKVNAYRYFITGLVGCLIGHVIMGVLAWQQWLIKISPVFARVDWNVVIKSALLWGILFLLYNFAIQIFYYLKKPKTEQASEHTLVRENFQDKIEKAIRNLEHEVVEERWKGFREFKVIKREAECPDASIVSFYLKPYDNSSLPRFRPGQYLTFRLSRVPGQDKPVMRCYSLSDSHQKDYYRVSIKRVPPPRDKPHLPPGLSSNFFHDHVQEGDSLEVKAPSGKFYLDETSSRGVVLIAGGVGVTPVLSMLNSLVDEKSSREIWFFYGVINSTQHAMKEHLQRTVQDHANVHLVVCYSKPLETDQLQIDYHHEGRVSAELFRKTLPSSNYQYYICGPGPFMSSITEGLKSWGVPDKDVNFEAFGPASVPKKKTEAKTVQSAEVAFKSSGTTLNWNGEHENLLELALENDIDLKFSCRIGNCSSCQVPLLQGEVDYPNGQPGAEIESGHCLLCVGVPKGNIVIDA